MPLSSANESPAFPHIDRRVPAVLFGLTIVLSAFLLFQVQPLIAKLILPWFGGSAAVWTSCMLFFQIALLGGYAYAHWLTRQPGSRQYIIHIGLLLVSLLSLPILPSETWKPQGSEDPLLRILGLLTVTVGLPYFLLSSTSPLLQSWYSRTNGGALPYRFFALSNAGSVLGLLTYPVLVEPNLPNRLQASSWSVGFAVFAAVCVVVAWKARDTSVGASMAAEEDTAPAPQVRDKLLWMALAACASALLLAVTNHLTQNVAAIPLLWVLPLSLYLLSFILCFDSDRWYNRWLFTKLGAVSLLSMVYLISDNGLFTNLMVAVAMFSVGVFVLFMVCHGEVAKRRPAPRYLTSFYLMVSVGGAIGGLFIGFVAPYVFNALYDLPVVFALTGFLFLYLVWLGRGSDKASEEFDLDRPVDRIVVGVLAGGAFLFAAVRLALWKFTGAPALMQSGYDAKTLLGIAFALAAYLMWRARGSLDSGIVTFAVALGLACGMTGFMIKDSWDGFTGNRVMVRNFYGALVVYDQSTTGNMGDVRVLRHGTIDHGEQFIEPRNQRFPTTYYATKSGVGLAIRNRMAEGPMVVGVIGLGTGTTAAYARPLDHYYFYDINPLVPKIATTEFTFLPKSLGPHEVIMGDARLSMERELAGGVVRGFDVLAVDAFSGDAIPVHLLTREALHMYWKHLKPDGVLAVHVSNRYLALAPVVALEAAAEGRQARLINYDGEVTKAETQSDWVLITSRLGYFDQDDFKAVAAKIDPIPGLRIWTDDYSNLFKILR